ncbi:MAG: DUF192 domain-containing protein [Chloroflexota bacterium]|nr:DUF192 domain-containing protein [Chloroflexota bacterium]
MDQQGSGRVGRAGILAALLLAAFLRAPVVHATDSVIVRALPAHSTVLLSTGLADDAGVYAVVYLNHGTDLGVVRDRDGKEQLIWTHHLYGTPSSLVAAEHQGLFLATVKGHGREVRLYAFDLHGAKVESAISGVKGGEVMGDAGLHLGRDYFVVRTVDTAHVGSVRYRLQQRYNWSTSQYAPIPAVHVPDYPPGGLPMPNGIVKTTTGDTVLIRLQVADTDQLRETGLMDVKSMDPDSGMVFVWPAPVLESFWMENTLIPLSVAFVGPDGMVQEIQDMAPLTTTLHTPQKAYQYAIEANQGFFAENGIEAGQRVTFHLMASSASSIKGVSSWTA